MEEENKKSNMGIIVFLVILVLGLAGYICYDKFLKKEPTTIEEKQSNDLYEIKSLKSYELYEAFYDDEKGYLTDDDKITKDNANVNIEYITVNYETDSVKKFNQDRKKEADELLDFYDNVFKESDSKFGCTCVKENGKYGCTTHLSSLDYKVNESSDYLLIEKKDSGYTHCAGGWATSTYYTISKDTKEVLDNEDILDIFNYNQEDIDKMIESAVKSKYAYYFDEGAISNDEITRLSSMNYFIHNNKLYMYSVSLPGSGNDYYVFDGKNITAIEGEFDLR